eukprot:400360-Alexandrium_andersonii.AAC.1
MCIRDREPRLVGGQVLADLRREVDARPLPTARGVLRAQALTQDGLDICFLGAVKTDLDPAR